MMVFGLISLLLLTGSLIYFLVEMRKDYASKFIKLSALNKVLQQENTGYAKEHEQLRHKSKWHQHAFHSTENIVFVFELDQNCMPGNIMDANDVACRILGYQLDDMLTLSPLDILAEQEAIPSMGLASTDDGSSPETAPNSRKGRFYTRETRVLMERILEKDTLVFSGTYATQNESRIPVEVTARCFNIDGHNFIVASAQDITGRQKTQHALDESEQRFRNFFRQSPIGMAIYDAERRLNDVNPACLRMFGCPSKEEFVNLNMFDNPFIPEPAKKPVSEGESAHFEAAFDFGRVRKEFLFVSSRNGECFYDILLTGLGHDANFKTRGYLAQVQDITERKKTETALTQSEKMLKQAEKMEAIGSMAGGIAHDFNNILTPLLGYAEIALRSVERGSAMSNYLEEILKASHRAKDLVDQILAFSRKNDKEGQPIHILPIVKEVLNLIKTSLPDHVEVERIIKTERDVVHADPTQMHQVFMNLCTNAAHAMKQREQGTLELRVTDFLLDTHYRSEFPKLEAGRYLRISVKDTGTGMDQATLERIFEPFFTTKGKGEGTGLGLSVVHSIISNCKGRITVESELDKGTTFNVILPLLEDQAGAMIADSVSPLPTGKETVLIVDDEPEIVEMIATMLGSLGYHPVFATSGKEAVEKFQSSPSRFDLVIVDQVMPGISGSQLAIELMMTRSDIPIILCTGYSDALSHDELTALGIAEIIKKPIVMKDLAETVRRVIDGKAG